MQTTALLSNFPHDLAYEFLAPSAQSAINFSFLIGGRREAEEASGKENHHPRALAIRLI
jgi:hypothetical protein